MAGFAKKTTDVFIQDQTTPFVNWFLSQKLGNVTLSENSTKGLFSFNANPGHNIEVGNWLEFWESSIFFQVEVIGVETNIIEISKPFTFSFTTNAIIKRVNIEMNVDGSETNVEFTFKPESLQSFDIYGLVGIGLTGSNVPDLSKFLGISALTNGVLAGKINPSLSYNSIPYNFKNNTCFILNDFSLVKTDKAPAGTYGVELVKNWKNTEGVNPRVLGAYGEYIFATIRDNINTEAGITFFRIMLHGHLVIN